MTLDPFVSLPNRDTGYNMTPADYNTMVRNQRNLNERVALLEAAGGGGLIEPTNVPVGGILMWPKSMGEIPSGWQVADGTNGTFDLRNFFIYGATADADLGTSGGSLTHSHANSGTGIASGHTHSGSGTTGEPSASGTSASGTSLTQATATHKHSFAFTTASGGEHKHSLSDTGEASSLPPFVKVFFIQRMS